MFNIYGVGKIVYVFEKGLFCSPAIYSVKNTAKTVIILQF